jgi:hypothetical protein
MSIEENVPTVHAIAKRYITMWQKNYQDKRDFLPPTKQIRINSLPF